jgi:hypothetical protein
MAQVFDISDATQFFGAIERCFQRYQSSREKSTEDLLFVVMGLNHLREWIAPEYKPKCGPDPNVDGSWPLTDTPEKEFSREVYRNDNHKIIRKVCNGTKHAKRISHTTATEHERNVLAWSDFLAVADVYKGPPIAHLVDGYPVERYIEPLIALYRTWFAVPVGKKGKR